MAKYVLCPRCELNYMLEGEELCDVCKAQLETRTVDMFTEEEEICPKCKINPVEPGEKYCSECLEKMRLKGVAVDEIEQEDDDVEKVSFEEVYEKELEDDSDMIYDDPTSGFQEDIVAQVDDIVDDEELPPIDEIDDEEIFDEEVEDEEVVEETDDTDDFEYIDVDSVDDEEEEESEDDEDDEDSNEDDED